MCWGGVRGVLGGVLGVCQGCVRGVLEGCYEDELGSGVRIGC